MTESFIIALLQNTAFLLAFAMLYENFWIRNENPKSFATKIFAGLVLGAIGIVLMFTPWRWSPGIVFDTRSVMLAISGLFFGGIPTIVAIIITASTRLIMGGEGQWMGIAVIISSGLIGLLWRKYRPDWQTKRYYLELLMMGIVVHIVMSLCTFFLPANSMLPTLKIIALPLILVYSPATMILGVLMLKQLKNAQNTFAQLKLIESERRLTQVLESGNIASIILNNDGTIKYCNRYFLEIAGYAFEEIEGKNWFTIFIAKHEQVATFQQFSEDIYKKRVKSNREINILSKSGEQIILLFYNTLLFSKSGEVIGIARIGVDVTKNKMYEKQLKEKNKAYQIINKNLIQEKEKAKESERMKSDFLTNMSHEIRSPLHSMLSLANLLKNPNLKHETQLQYLNIIEKSGSWMLNIINNTINLSKIDAGNMHADVVEENLNKNIQFVYDLFKAEMEAKEISFSYQTALPNQESVIKTDHDKLISILINLVRNALKYTNQGSIGFGYEVKGNYLEFMVKDTGIGIPDDKKEAVFERFTQAEIDYKLDLQGTGLGLSICKAYVELLGGKIWVDNHAGEGSIFQFTIPYYPAIPD